MKAAGAVPAKEELAKELNGHLAMIFGEVWRIAQRELELHGHEVSERLEAALDQVRLDQEPTQHPIIVAPSIVIPQVSLLAPEALGFGALGWLVTLAFAPAYALAGAIGSFFFGAWWGREKQLVREIEKVERKISDHIRSLVNPARDLLKGIRSGHGRLDRHIADRWAVFEKDVRAQLSAAGTELSQDERNGLGKLDAELLAARRRLEFVAEEIRWTPAVAATSRSGAVKSAVLSSTRSTN